MVEFLIDLKTPMMILVVLIILLYLINHYIYEYRSFEDYYNKKEFDYIEETLKHIATLLETPTRENIIKAAHLYTVLPSITYKRYIHTEHINTDLVWYLLELLVKESNSSHTLDLEELKPQNRGIVEQDSLIKLSEFIYSELDALYETHDKNFIRYLDSEFEDYFKYELVFNHSCLTFMNDIEAFEDNDEDEDDGNFLVFELSPHFLRNLLILVCLKDNVTLKYLNGYKQVDKSWERADLRAIFEVE